MTRSRQTADWGSRAGLAKIVPSSVAVGSGTGSSDSLGNVTFSGCSSVSLNDVFSSTYDQYKINLTLTYGGTATLQFRFRVSNADNSSGVHFTERMLANNTTISAALVDSSATLFTLDNDGSGGRGDGIIDITTSPFASNIKQLGSTFYKGGTPVVRINGHLFNSTTSFTGFTFIASASTISGTISVYGYTK
jgi:hypothetical protein